jgi:hypothetical protein
MRSTAIRERRQSHDSDLSRDVFRSFLDCRKSHSQLASGGLVSVDPSLCAANCESCLGSLRAIAYGMHSEILAPSQMRSTCARLQRRTFNVRQIYVKEEG